MTAEAGLSPAPSGDALAAGGMTGGMTGKVRTRFAPSPTGFLHIGGARTTLYNWLFARRHRGEFVLRIEDTDEVRSDEDSVTAILDSIRWLGLNWDEGPLDLKTDQGPYGPYYQMKRLDTYRVHIDRLLEQGKAYPCYCTKDELDAMRRLAQLEKRPPRYDGRCRELTQAKRSQLETEGRKPALRFRMPDDGVTVVSDLIRGSASFENNLLQDFVIQKITGGPTYNFACVVDDHLMEISHVIRGDEHLSNTPSQLQIYKALGWTPPRFAHLSMILGPDGTKLSKRHGATSVLEYRKAGFLPETMRNYLALLGWSTPDSQQLFTSEELVGRFDLAGCQKSPAMFDSVKLTWMNGEYLRKLPLPALLAQAEPFLKEAGLFPVNGDAPSLEKTVALEHEKFKLLADIPGLVEFFYKDVSFTPKALVQLEKEPATLGILQELAALMRDFAPFTDKELEARVRRYCEEKGIKTGAAFHPLRAACTGRTEGPTLFLMMEVMGREQVVRRLEAAAGRKLTPP